MPIYPLVGINVVQEGLQGVMNKQHVQDALESASETGADGIHIARNYAEMRLENVKAAGEALRTLGKSSKSQVLKG